MMEAVLCELCKAGERQKAVLAASGRGQGDGGTDSADHQSVSKDGQLAACCNARGAFSSAWLKTEESLNRTMEVNVESAVKRPPEQPTSPLKQKTKVISGRVLNTEYSVKVAMPGGV